MTEDGFYYEAASIVDSVRSGKGRIKSLCYNSKHRNKKALFAVVTEVCKNYQLLSQTLQNSSFLEKEKRVKPSVAIILVHDLVNDRLPKCSPKLSEPVLRNKTRLKAEYVKLKIKIPTNKIIRPFRYARVNTLRVSLEDCIKQLAYLGYNQVKSLTAGEGLQFALDEHLADLLVFPPGTDLTKTNLYKDGSIVLQDKASCIPVAVLQPPLGASVLDACAAPGNKTSQLAAIVGGANGGGRVFAFERDSKRALILGETLKKYNCDHITVARCKDFLSVNPLDYPMIEYGLVDPSCSGSGMLEEFEQSVSNDEEEDSELDKRLLSLSNFQCMILRHAMSFPNMKRVVYSTCSIHKEENENVVKQILQLEPKYRLVKFPLSSWTRRGLPEYEFSQSVIRADPMEDRMNGFFVACFEKIDSN